MDLIMILFVIYLWGTINHHKEEINVVYVLGVSRVSRVSRVLRVSIIYISLKFMNGKQKQL